MPPAVKAQSLDYQGSLQLESCRKPSHLFYLCYPIQWSFVTCKLIKIQFLNGTSHISSTQEPHVADGYIYL